MFQVQGEEFYKRPVFLFSPPSVSIAFTGWRSPKDAQGGGATVWSQTAYRTPKVQGDGDPDSGGEAGTCQDRQSPTFCGLASPTLPWHSRSSLRLACSPLAPINSSGHASRASDAAGQAREGGRLAGAGGRQPPRGVRGPSPHARHLMTDAAESSPGPSVLHCPLHHS